MISEEELFQADELFNKLFPINRSITGNGVRETLKILDEIVPIKICEIASGTDVFDWKIPDEWNINSGWIKNSKGEKIVDFQNNNLHILNYSEPVCKKVNFEELLKHTHTLPSKPDLIPYRTSYYEKKWGFCMSYNTLLSLNKDDIYEVFIDSNLDKKGSLTYGEIDIKGKGEKEYLISTYTCHPSMANDNLSGIILTILLVKHLNKCKLNNNYKIIFAPETIGAIAFLSKNKKLIKGIEGGFIVTTVAGKGKFGFKETFLGDSDIDKSILLALGNMEFIKYPFIPDGSDERQYSSPGFRIPVASITKDKYYEYDEYHTSGDNLNFISSECLLETLQLYKKAINNLERNILFTRTNPYCEYQLGKYGLYPKIGGEINQPLAIKNQKAMSSNQKINCLGWLSFLCDGTNSLMDISLKSKIDMDLLYAVASEMEKFKLLKKI